MTIRDFRADQNLFGALPAFRDLASWQRCLAFLAASHGLPMTKAQLAAFRAYADRQTPRPEGYSEVVAIVGRQLGKSRIAAMVATFEAVTASEEVGAELSALLVAQARSELHVVQRTCNTDAKRRGPTS